MSNVSYDPWDNIDLSPEDTIDVYKKNTSTAVSKDPWDDIEFSENFWKNAFRTALQIPQGYVEATGPGIAAGLWHLLGQGEVLDPEEIDRIRAISEREGIPFDEEAYIEAAQNALSYVPTVSNIARGIEERTDIPLEPKEWYQKALRLGTTAGKFQPGTAGEKLTAGITAPAITGALESVGVPEPLAELAGLAGGRGIGSFGPKVEIGKSVKPSGLIERRFEALMEPQEVAETKLSQISDKLEKDFKGISDRIIKESPVGETFENLKNDPTFKQESRVLLDEAQNIANSIPDPLFTSTLKREYANISSQKVKGVSLNEYDKSYLKFMKEAIEDIIPEKTNLGELVKQYRKNNASLSEYYEPGASKALNRAKKDALLDQNRAIANIIENSNAELSTIFKEGNSRWTKIMDAEAVDSFISEMFEEKVNYKKMHDFFDETGYDRIFKRALGEEGYKDFSQLMKDMLTSERGYKMLKAARSKGYDELFKAGLAYLVHPKIAGVKLGYDAAKHIYKGFFNSLLDKPRMAFTWKRGADALKKGKFDEANKEFKILKDEVEGSIKPQESKNLKSKVDAKLLPEPRKLLSEPVKEKPKVEPEKPSTIKEKKPKTKKEASKKIEKPKSKRQDISSKGLKNQKEFILNKIDDVIANPEKYKGQEKIFFDVPGDGEFRIHNNEKALKQFYKKVKQEWPDRPILESVLQRKMHGY